MSSEQGARILVVDDVEDVVSWLVDSLEEEGFEVVGETSPTAALERVRRERFDLVVSDVEMPEMRGPDLLAAVQAERPELLVLLITAFGSIDLAVQCVRAGASDFVTKPFPIEALVHAIERALRERRMRREIVRLRSALPGDRPRDVVARSLAMRRVVELATRAAQTTSSVLITGESGTGKGFLARLIHDRGPRAEAPFVQVNCAALPDQLVESELFGVRRGAFTDAQQDRPGLFVKAHRGTLFLDEVGELPLESQAKLLQVLESGKVRPLGGQDETPVDVRILAATNRPLEEALRERRFRPDLYYRLNVIRLEVPPLRDRPEDVEALIDLFLHRAAQKVGRPVIGISAEAMRYLLGHAWPGNVREVANLLERAVALTEHDTIGLDDLLVPAPPGAEGESLEDAAARGLTLEELERRYIQKVLERAGGNKVQAARILGIDRRTLYRKVDG